MHLWRRLWSRTRSAKASLSRGSRSSYQATRPSCSPLDLSRGIGAETGLLHEAFTMDVVRYTLDLDLAAMKTSLANGLSTVHTLLCLKSRGKQKKLLLDLLYRVTELEYNIYTQPE